MKSATEKGSLYNKNDGFFCQNPKNFDERIFPVCDETYYSIKI
jgi:hypothetical protein